MAKIFKLLNKNDTNGKKKAIRQAIIDYYNTINYGKLAIPSFMLADISIKRNRAYDRVDELYEKLFG